MILYVLEPDNEKETFCEQSHMTVNVPKTNWMIFEKKAIDQTSAMNIFFNGEALEKVDSFKNLGIFFSTNLNFSEHMHVNDTLIKAEKASHLFWKYVNRFPSLKVSVIVNLFNVLVTPILLYCAELWFLSITQDEVWENRKI